MGFESAVVIAIFFLYALFMGTQSYIIISASNDIVNEAEQIESDMQYLKLNSEITIESMKLNDKATILTVTATNSGAITFDSDKLTILLDGVIVNATDMNKSKKWYPQESKDFNITYTNGFKNLRVKFVTANGVASYFTGIPGNNI